MSIIKKPAVLVVTITISCLALAIAFLGLISLFFAMYSNVEVVYNDTEEMIDIEPIITMQSDETKRTSEPRLMINPGEIKDFKYDWDDSRYQGIVILNYGGGQSYWCGGKRRGLDEPYMATFGLRWLSLKKYEIYKAYYWSDFEECEQLQLM
ncbi:MAG: hypothetical protein ABH826_03585 [Patescibacteria group bacterium]